MIRYFKQLFCNHTLEMWTYIGERYTFHCEKCDEFFHVDNTDFKDYTHSLQYKKHD